MQKYVLMFDDCLKLDEARLAQIHQQFCDDLCCADTPIIILPPGVSVVPIEAEVKKAAKATKHEESNDAETTGGRKPR